MIHNPKHRIAKMRKEIAAVMNRECPRSLSIVLAARCFYWREHTTWFETAVVKLKRSPTYHSEERMLKAALKQVRKIKRKCR